MAVVRQVVLGFCILGLIVIIPFLLPR